MLLPAGIQIIGVNDSDGAPSTSERPLIGGAAAGLATHLFEIRAQTAEDDTITISRLRFVGEDEASLDSPIALWVRADDEFEATVEFVDNICERPHMNDSGASGARESALIEHRSGGKPSACTSPGR